MKLRPFNPKDAAKILSWCKDKHTFQLWSADRYEDFPAQPKEMMKQYKGDYMYPLTPHPCRSSADGRPTVFGHYGLLSGIIDLSRHYLKTLFPPYRSLQNIAYLKARLPIAPHFPAIEMAGYPYLMPTASHPPHTPFGHA